MCIYVKKLTLSSRFMMALCIYAVWFSSEIFVENGLYAREKMQPFQRQKAHVGKYPSAGSIPSGPSEDSE